VGRDRKDIHPDTQDIQHPPFNCGKNGVMTEFVFRKLAFWLSIMYYYCYYFSYPERP